MAIKSQASFEAVKELFNKNTQLFHPDTEGTFVLYTDTSDQVVGAVLYECDQNDELKVIEYANRTLKGAEKNYFTSEKEILAIIYAINKF